MRKMLIIGIGAGDPDYITVQAINALNQVDVFFVIDKGEEKDDLVVLAQTPVRQIYPRTGLPYRRSA